MAIGSSSFAAGPAQRDGRVWITETHTDSVVGALLFAYLAADTSNAAAVMNARVAAINTQLADTEFEASIAISAAPSLLQQTAAQFAARFRTRYLNSIALDCARLAKWILDRIDAGDFTDLQARNAFGLTANQYTTLKAKWTTLRTNYNAALVAQGE